MCPVPKPPWWCGGPAPDRALRQQHTAHGWAWSHATSITQGRVLKLPLIGGIAAARLADLWCAPPTRSERVMKTLVPVALLALAFTLTPNAGAQSQVSITIDATALTRQQLDVLNLTTGTDTTFFDSGTAHRFQFVPGPYALQMQGGNENVAEFAVSPDGTISYDSSLEGTIYSGHGTTVLTVNAWFVGISAKALSPQQLSLYGVVDSFDNATDQQLQLVPGQYHIQSPMRGVDIGQFTLHPDSSITFDPSLSNIFSISDNVRNLIVINGFPISVDGTALSPTQLAVYAVNPNMFDSQTPQAFTLVPGQYMAQEPMTGVNIGNFTVGPDGKVDFDASLDSDFSGRGTNTLYIYNGPGGGQCPGISPIDAVNAIGADWSVQPSTCLPPNGSPQPLNPPPAPMVVTRQKLMLTGDAPGRRAPRSGGDPVLGDGEFFEQRVDAELAGFGPHYLFKRTYRSRVNYRSPLGNGWDHNYDRRLLGPQSTNGISPYCDSGIDYQDGELNTIHFVRETVQGNTERYRAPYGVAFVLERDLSEQPWPTWLIRDADGNRIRFDTYGYLSSITDLAGNSLSFSWEPSGQQNPDDAYYGPSKRLSSVSDASRKVNYIYDANGYLQCITVGSQCGTAAARLAGVLAYFSIDSKVGELIQVYHGAGQDTRAERYAYYDNGSNVISSPPYSPLDCRPDIHLDQLCHRLCDSVDNSSPDQYSSTCLNIGDAKKETDACAHMWCELVPDPKDPLHTKFITKCAHSPTNHDPDGVCQLYYWLNDCVGTCLSNYQCQATFNGETNARSFYSFGVADDLRHNLTDVFDETNALVVHNEYGTTPWDISFDRVISQHLGPDSGDPNVVTFEYHDLLTPPCV